ncbi:MAG: RluA family pseudouridine synthase [Ruminococcus sp.]|nr:RluA family pseudouridine synthase [Ruminococcus sp.]
MEHKKLEFTVPSECDGMNANVFLKKYCKVSARMITRLKREKDGIIRDEKILRTIDTVRAGDTIILSMPTDKNEVIPIKGELNILYEDDYIIALDKPSDTPVHPTKIHQTDTLANFLAYRQQRRGESFTFRAINRLDKDTSGIVVVAKDRYTAHQLFKNMNKTYAAVCEGIIVEKGTIDKPIRLLEDHTIQRTTAPDGAPSVTHYTPILHTDRHTLLSITLETGHTHQIRCHFSSIGYPLAGDDMYGGSLNFITRQALHCDFVSFVHPITGKFVEIKSELPEDIKDLIN